LLLLVVVVGCCCCWLLLLVVVVGCCCWLLLLVVVVAVVAQIFVPPRISLLASNFAFGGGKRKGNKFAKLAIRKCDVIDQEDLT